MKSVTILVLGVLALLISPNNGTAQWVKTNLSVSGHPEVYSLAANNGILFAGSNGEGVYRSTDNGEHWAAADSAPLWMTVVTSRLPHPPPTSIPRICMVNNVRRAV